jgi:hypothetical protein
MTDKLMLKWLNMVQKRDLCYANTMLVVDSFHGYMTEWVKVEVNDDSDLLVIPAGITKLLYPLDVVINQPFKVTYWKLYNHWMTTMKHELTPSSRMRSVLFLIECQWILAVRAQFLRKL